MQRFQAISEAIARLEANAQAQLKEMQERLLRETETRRQNPLKGIIMIIKHIKTCDLHIFRIVFHGSQTHLSTRYTTQKHN